MKSILPSLKEKKRYVVFEVISEKKINKEMIEKSINESVLQFIGELGVAKSGYLILKDSITKNKGIIRTNINMLNEVKMALSLIKNINKDKVIVNVVGVSGILNKAQSKFM